jgi:DNA-binding YbaB/EbfC family protein
MPGDPGERSPNMASQKNLNKLMKQAQQMQAKVAALSEEIGAREVTATAGGGMVEVVANGRHELTSISIKPEVVDRDDIEMLEDLIVAACNEAHKKAEEMMQSEMEKVTGGLQIPGLF